MSSDFDRGGLEKQVVDRSLSLRWHTESRGRFSQNPTSNREREWKLLAYTDSSTKVDIIESLALEEKSEVC